MVLRSHLSQRGKRMMVLLTLVACVCGGHSSLVPFNPSQLCLMC